MYIYTHSENLNHSHLCYAEELSLLCKNIRDKMQLQINIGAISPFQNWEYRMVLLLIIIQLLPIIALVESRNLKNSEELFCKSWVLKIFQ